MATFSFEACLRSLMPIKQVCQWNLTEKNLKGSFCSKGKCTYVYVYTCGCVRKWLTSHFRHIVSNLDQCTCFTSYFVLPTEKPAFAKGPRWILSQSFYQNTPPKSPNGKSVQRTAFANDFLPTEMWEAIKEVSSSVTAFPAFAEFTGVLLLSNTL